MNQPSKKFALSFLVAFALMWLSVVTVHVLGNPDEMFSSPLVPNRGNRSWKSRRLVDAIEAGKPPAIFVLGSSRLMQFSPMLIESITGQRAFNYADTGSSPMEYLAQLKFVLHEGVRPQTLIVGIDERAMFGSYRQWEGQIAEDWHTLRQLPLGRQMQMEWQSITQIQFAHTPAAIHNIFVRPQLQIRQPKSVGNFFLADGYRIRVPEALSLKKHRWDPQQREQWLRNFADNAIATRNESFANLSIQPQQRERVEQLLDLAKSKKIRVKLIVTPMHPYYAQRVLDDNERRQMDQYAAELKAKCKKLGFDFYDFRDLKSFQGLDYEFWDEQHPTPVNTARMINCIFGVKATTRHPDVPDDASLVLNPPAVNSLNTW